VSRTALWVVPVGDLGGVARHVLDVARTGIPDWRLVVLTPPGALAEELQRRDVPTLTESFGPGAGVRASRNALHHAVTRLRPDVVHSHLAYADIVAATVDRGRSALVSTEHGIAANDRVYHGSRRVAARAALVHRVRLTRFDALIAVSEATARAMRAKWQPRQPITVLRNGIDHTNVSAGGASGRSPGLRMASLARLAPEKGLAQLLNAFAVVLADHPRARLTIAGDGPLRDDLVRRSNVLGIADAVDFPGYVDAADLLRRTDVLAQLSVWENCSYSLLDAVTSGVGVVATPVGGNPEILPARCLAEADDPDAVAAAVVSQGMHIGERPCLPTDWPSVREMTAGIAAVYAEAIQRRGDRRG